MQQIIRRVIDKKGKIEIKEIPTPNTSDNQVLIATHYSLISSGTELGTINKDPVEMAKLTLQDPWMRNAVKNLVFSGSFRTTKDIIINELTLFRMIGYSGAGEVINKGKNIIHVNIGDKVAFAAQGHAEQVAAYANHVVKVPDNVNLQNAAFVTVGGIALQGIRKAKIELGEWVLVYGLGLVGQITMQLWQACGAKVIGIHIHHSRLELAKENGLKYAINPGEEEPINGLMRITGGKGVDKTLICAVSKNPEIANNAMKMTRKQGKVVFVGIVKMDLERKPFFLNELDLSFSRAYGPGSYDEAYETGRIEYPYHYVRWTEKQNLAEIMRLMEDNKLNVENLIDSVYPLENAQNAFDKIRSGDMNSVAMLLTYEQNKKIEARLINPNQKRKKINKKIINIGIIGTGNFTRNYHIPNLKRISKFKIYALASSSGINSSSIAEKLDVAYNTTDYKEMLKDDEIDAVIIATRHNKHAQIAMEAAKAGKHVFIEKPIAMTLDDLDNVKSTIQESGVGFMAGFNRRYAPIANKAYKYITQLPIMVNYTVNIQHLPDSHWTLDSEEGGGRLLGEADHFFDLINYFVQSKPINVHAFALPVNDITKEGLFNFMVQIK